LPFEPRIALLGGADGLDALRILAREASAHLLPDGWLLVEHGMGQQDAVRALLEAAGLETEKGWPDLAGIPRVAGGRVKSPHGH
jgi:release factor glutamine methyltransferase